jgi:serine/threonine protein kinase
MCSRQKKRMHDSDYVSKAQLIKHSESEMQITKKIREIPSWRYYFIVPEEEICNPTVRNMDLLHKCEPMQEADRTNIGIYHMKYGGVPIGSANIELNKFNIKFFLKHLLEAVDRLHSKNLVHADLHSGNILIDDKYIPRIIDFGQMTAMNEMDEDKILRTFYVFDEGYEQMPVECLLFSGKKKYANTDFRVILKHTFRMRRVFKELSTILNYSIEKQIEDLTSWWISINQSTDPTEFWKQVAPTFDVWSVGVITLHLISKFTLWPKYKIDEDVVNVLRKICSLNPHKRWSAKKALDSLAESL